MSVLQNLKDFFTSQEAESDAVKKRQEEHAAKLPALQARFDELDAKCVDANIRYRAARNVGSPKAYEMGAEVSRLRADRDAPMREWRDQKDRLETEQMMITGPMVREFMDVCNARLKSLGPLYRERQGSTQRAVVDGPGEGMKDIKVINIMDNTDALQAAEDVITAARSRIRDLNGKASLREVRAAIENCLAEFDRFDFSVLRPRKVTLGMLKAARADRRPSTVDAGKAIELDARLSVLERRKS